MRKLIAAVGVLILFLLATISKAQERVDHPFKSSIPISLEEFDQNKKSFDDAKADEKYYLLVEFNKLPTKTISQLITREHIQLHNYLGHQIYLAEIPATTPRAILKGLGIVSIAKPTAALKVSSRILHKNYPDWASDEKGKLDVTVLFHKGLSTELIQQVLDKYSFQILEKERKKGAIQIGRINIENLEDLANEAIVSFIDVIQEPVQMLNYENRMVHNASPINSNLLGDRNLNGEGVCVGIGDGGELGTHIDFGNRVFNETNGSYPSFGDHGDHVSGIVGSAGNINPHNRGMASKCNLVTQKTSMITYSAEDYILDYGMVLTNNSYGTVNDCETNGEYSPTSHQLDWQLTEHPELLHIFASGNNGSQSCSPFPQGFGTVLKHFQSAKNILTVGNIQEDRTIKNNSSRGPVQDGRLKPEIVGVGTWVYSTGNDNNYNAKSGTSMAAPAVAGNLALFYQRYRQLNNGMNPDGGLIKAITCNTAEDLGNPGPDFTYGFGVINSLHAIETIEENRYLESEISTGEQNVHNIDVPEGTSQVRVMLYWQDKASDPDAAIALLNNLDMKLTDPSGNMFDPWILNPAPEHVNDNAIRGIDNLNNIEQVTIDFPSSGNYTITINGSEIPFGPQKYYLTYEFIDESITVTHPWGGESFDPNTTQMIQWDTDPNNMATFRIELSSDNGNTWEILEDQVEATKRFTFWNIPAEMNTSQALIRISKNGTSITDVSNHIFNVLQSPIDVVETSNCGSAIQISWNELEYATSYEVFKYDGNEMTSIAITTETSYMETGLTAGKTYWFAVRALNATGGHSERSIAIPVTTDSIVDCVDQDAGLVMVATTPLGRKNTSHSLSTAELVKIEIINIGLESITNIPVSYQVNDGEIISEICNFTIESGESMIYAFAQTVDMSAAAVYKIDVWSDLSEDSNIENNSIIDNYQAEQLPNEPLALPYYQNFNDMEQNIFTQDFMGFGDNRRWDVKSNGNAEIEISPSGRLTLYPVDNATSQNDNAEVMITINLVDYIFNPENINMSFTYNSNSLYNASLPSNMNNKVWVRGSDEDEWIYIYNIMDNLPWQGTTLHLGEVLQKGGQNFSTSTQVRFTQNNAYGFVIDEFEIHQGDIPYANLLKFEVYPKDGNAILDWETTENESLKYFQIEMAKASGEIADDDFEYVTRVYSTGSESNFENYNFIDEQTQKQGMYSYRLKQVNQDDSFIYSSIESVNFNEPLSTASFYPNPFHSQLNLQYTCTQSEILEIQLIDIKGLLISQFHLEVESGEQSIPLAIDQHLPKGVYYIKLNNQTNFETYKIVKGE